MLYDEEVNEKDLDIMAGYWLESDEIVPTSDPGIPLAHYKLEGNVSDTGAAPANNGTAFGLPFYNSTDVIEGVLSIELDGADDYVTFGAVGIDSNDARTVAVWAKMGVPASSMTGWTNVFGFTAGSGQPGGQGNKSFDIERRGNEDTYCLHVYGQEWNIVPLDEEWHHLAGTFDGTTVAWYGDGLLVGTEVRDVNTVDNVQMGRRADNDNYFNGLIDDARIYDRALTAPEVAFLADIDAVAGGLYIPMDPAAEVANIYDGEPEGSKWINFMDFAVLANDWLEKEPIWP